MSCRFREQSAKANPSKTAGTYRSLGADQNAATIEIGRNPTQDLVGHLEINLVVQFECEAWVSPAAIGLVPHTPIPIPYDVASPLLNTTPDQIAATLCEPLDHSRIAERRPKANERNHRGRAGFQNGIDIACESRPVRNWIGRPAIECINSNNLRLDGA